MVLRGRFGFFSLFGSSNVLGSFFKILGSRERTKEEKRVQDAPYFPILQSYSEMPRRLNAIVYPSH